MNAHVFRRLCEELAPKLAGARLEKIHALSAEVSQWSFYGHGERFALLLRAHRQAPFLFTATQRVAVGAEPPTFIMRFRKYLGGQRVTGTFCHWVERRLWLRFFPGTEVWLCLDLREGPALSWEAPEALDPAALMGGEGPTPLEPEGSSLERTSPAWPSVVELAQATPDAWRTWSVLSPALRRTLAVLPLEEQAALLVDLEAGGGDFFVYSDADGSKAELSAWPLPDALRGEREERVFDDPLAAVRIVGEERVLAGLSEESARRAAKPHAAEVTRLKKLLAKLELEESRLSQMAESIHDALALQGTLYLFAADEKKAMIEVEHGDALRPITLDPRLTIRENMAALFHRAGRGRRGLAMLSPRRETVWAELEAARLGASIAAGLAAGTAPAALIAAAAKAAKKKLVKPVRGVAPSGGKQLPKGVQAFRSSDGVLLLRGRDARGNVAALKLGGPGDLWLHAEGAVGAHVIVRIAAGQAVSETTLREAAVLAALKSPYKDAGTAVVQCALVKHVHPMRGASPGMVRIDKHEPGLTVRVDAGLEKALSHGE